jgi:hypothetical protein
MAKNYLAATLPDLQMWERQGDRIASQELDRRRLKLPAAPTKLYNAANPQQIIDVFEHNASNAERMARNQTKVKEHALYAREASTWRAAADILRNTEFVGWDLATAATLRDPNAPPITKADYDWPITDTTHLDAHKEMAERDGEALDKITAGDRLLKAAKEMRASLPIAEQRYGRVKRIEDGSVKITPHPTAHLTDEQIKAMHKADNARVFANRNSYMPKSSMERVMLESDGWRTREDGSMFKPGI